MTLWDAPYGMVTSGLVKTSLGKLQSKLLEFLLRGDQGVRLCLGSFLAAQDERNGVLQQWHTLNCCHNSVRNLGN